MSWIYPVVYSGSCQDQNKRKLRYRINHKGFVLVLDGLTKATTTKNKTKHKISMFD